MSIALWLDGRRHFRCNCRAITDDTGFEELNFPSPNAEHRTEKSSDTDWILFNFDEIIFDGTNSNFIISPFGRLTKLLPNAGNWYHMLHYAPLRLLLDNKILWIGELLFLLSQMNLNYNFGGEWVTEQLWARVKLSEAPHVDRREKFCWGNENLFHEQQTTLIHQFRDKKSWNFIICLSILFYAVEWRKSAKICEKEI